MSHDRSRGPHFDPHIVSARRSWDGARADTRAILASVDDEQLLYAPPGPRWKSLAWQFGCLGRTQRVFSLVIKHGQMDFTLFGSPTLPAHGLYRTRAELERFLDETDGEWNAAIGGRIADSSFVIHWPGAEEMPLSQHIASLAGHERLHHGQFIAYFTLAGFELPESFRQAWALG